MDLEQRHAMMTSPALPSRRRLWRSGPVLAAVALAVPLVAASVAVIGFKLFAFARYKADLAAIRRTDTTIVEMRYGDEDPNRPYPVFRTDLACDRLRGYRDEGRGPEMLALLAIRAKTRDCVSRS